MTKGKRVILSQPGHMSKSKRSDPIADALARIEDGHRGLLQEILDTVQVIQGRVEELEDTIQTLVTKPPSTNSDSSALDSEANAYQLALNAFDTFRRDHIVTDHKFLVSQKHLRDAFMEYLQSLNETHMVTLTSEAVSRVLRDKLEPASNRSSLVKETDVFCALTGARPESLPPGKLPTLKALPGWKGIALRDRPSVNLPSEKKAKTTVSVAGPSNALDDMTEEDEYDEAAMSAV